MSTDAVALATADSCRIEIGRHSGYNLVRMGIPGPSVPKTDIVTRVITHLIVIIEAVLVEFGTIGPLLDDLLQQRLGKSPLTVLEFVAAHRLVVEGHLDFLEQVGGDHLETGACIDGDIVPRNFPYQVPVAKEEYIVLSRSVFEASVVDMFQIQLTSRHPAVPDPGIDHLFVAVGHRIAVGVLHHLQSPAENVSTVTVPENSFRVQPRARAAVEELRAVLVGHLPPVIRRTGAVADDPAELALDPRVELLPVAAAIGELAAMGDGRQHLPVEQVGFGLLSCIVARHAPAGVDRQRRKGEIPPHPQPAVSAA